jgi:hypothetical protein
LVGGGGGGPGGGGGGGVWVVVGVGCVWVGWGGRRQHTLGNRKGSRSAPSARQRRLGPVPASSQLPPPVPASSQLPPPVPASSQLPPPPLRSPSEPRCSSGRGRAPRGVTARCEEEEGSGLGERAEGLTYVRVVSERASSLTVKEGCRETLRRTPALDAAAAAICRERGEGLSSPSRGAPAAAGEERERVYERVRERE